MQLFGVLSKAVSPHIASTLHIHHPRRGQESLQYLERTYGQIDANDATTATMRVLTCHIDPRSRPSVAAVQHQFDCMTLANNDVVAAGGTPIPETTLIPFFHSCLSGPAYSLISRLVRDKRPQPGTLLEVCEA